MKTRCIVCQSRHEVVFLRAWLPPGISDSSSLFYPTRFSDPPITASDLLREHRVKALLIRNAYSTNFKLIDDLEVYAEERLTLSASRQQFEIEVVSPTLLVMLFETPKVFETVFGERATEFLHLMGSYDPERAIQEAGTSIPEIVKRLDDTTRELLRATPTARKILAGIARLDAKRSPYENGGDDVSHRHPPSLTQRY